MHQALTHQRGDDWRVNRRWRQRCQSSIKPSDSVGNRVHSASENDIHSVSEEFNSVAEDEVHLEPSERLWQRIPINLQKDHDDHRVGYQKK